MSEPTTAPQWPITLPAASWVTAGEVAEQWPSWADAFDDEDGDPIVATELARFLAAAQEQCAAFAPPLAEGQAVPTSWKVAVIMQARAIYRSTMAGDRNQVGVDGLAVTVFPMDWTVKNLLRPKRGGVWVR